MFILGRIEFVTPGHGEAELRAVQPDGHLLQGLILMMRNFYDQPERFESDFAVNNLIRAWKS